jgi:hypothetical protein
VWVIDIARVLDFLGRWTLVRFFLLSSLFFFFVCSLTHFEIRLSSLLDLGVLLAFVGVGKERVFKSTEFLERRLGVRLDGWNLDFWLQDCEDIHASL